MSAGAGMPRVVHAETLDGLAKDDPAAIRSRGDLRRIHRAMGTRRILRRLLRDAVPPRPHGSPPLRLLELGAGDGSLLLGVARALHDRWPAVELTLLDRQRLVEPSTIAAYAAFGWRATACTADVLDWTAGEPLPGRTPRMRGDEVEPGDDADEPRGDAAGPRRWDLVVANLFLHHFERAPLATLLGAIAGCSDRLVACEPRRAPLALLGSHLVGVLGANAVTREDAVLSVHAGFWGDELSALWPGPSAQWTLHEAAAGLFSHCFSARRRGPGEAQAHGRPVPSQR